MPFIVGITGTHSTGKSTFVDRLKERLEAEGARVELVADMATGCRDAGFPILHNHTYESTLWIMASVIRAELEAGLSAEVVIVDRPVPDALAYLRAALETQGRTLDGSQREYLDSLARLHGRQYDLLFKTELDAHTPIGPGRDPDARFRAEVDRLVAESLQELGLKFYSLCRDNVDSCLDIAARAIK